jgi:polysaccharide biosynthesis/export protein
MRFTERTGPFFVGFLSFSNPFRANRILTCLLGLIVFCLAGPAIRMRAQQNKVSTGSGEVAASKPKGDDTRYKIGAGDVLTIIVRKAKELSLDAIRVDQRGMIRIPMINEDIPAACRTESELATYIADLYREYKNNPSVEVFVREFQSRPVAVIGAVNAPGQFRLQRQVRLLELISFAGGPSNSAGRTVNITHTGGSIICQNDPTDNPATPALAGVTMLKLSDTLKGKEEANPFVQPGDIVQIPDADQVFVIGHVVEPKAIPLKDKPITVSWAVAMAGGPARDGNKSGVRIIRQTSSGGKQEIPIDLKAIQRQKAEDMVLFPNDIVEVGSSTSKTILNILAGTVPTAVSQGVVRAIP